MEAEFVKMDGGKVVLKMEGGKTRSVPINLLSAEDQEYVKELSDDPEESKEQSEGGANYDDPWPGEVVLKEKTIVTEISADEEKKEFIYHSEHYEFVSDVALKVGLIRKFATMFEATFQVMVDVPMNFQKARSFDSSKKLRILLFETRQAYVENGGPPSSGGVYIGSKNTVMVPLTSLGVNKVGSGYSFDYKVNNQTLSHELVHQLTDRAYYAHGSRGWFTEGLAEYVSTSPYKNGRYNFRSNIRAISKSVTEYDRKSQTGSSLGDEIVFKNLKKYMLQSYTEFTSNSRFNYAMGMVLMTYFIHMDDNGSRVNLNNFLKALRAGTKGEELVDVLRAGRTWAELEGQIAAAWRKKGIKIIFQGTAEEY